MNLCTCGRGINSRADVEGNRSTVLSLDVDVLHPRCLKMFGFFLTDESNHCGLSRKSRRPSGGVASPARGFTLLLFLLKCS